MAVNLLFSRPPRTSGPVDLVFGASVAPPTADPLTAHATIVLGGFNATSLAFYDNRNPLRATVSAVVPHQPAARALQQADGAWGLSTRQLGGHLVAWGAAARVQRENAAGWDVSERIAGAAELPWRRAHPLETDRTAGHQAALQVRSQAHAAYQIAARLQALTMARHGAGAARLAETHAAWENAGRLQALAVARHGSGLARAAQLLALWETSRPVPPGREVWPLVNPNPTLPRVPSTHLLFACPPWAGGPVRLVFGRVCGAGPLGPIAPVYILPARFYMAVHTLTAHTLPGLTPVPIFDVSLSADAGSFGWTFSASAPSSVFDQLAPTAGLPAQIRITLDGLQFAFVVDSLQRDERFGQRGARISGRSATALLARPYARDTARLSTAAATAQQLALDALEFSGVDLDWGLTDWLVPAGAWSHTGTPLAAVQAIVEAAGGYLQSHRSAATLLARHPYPELAGGLPGGPWNWYQPGVVPDVELALDAIITSGIERKDGADINGVYVSGVSQGVLALVRRDGTAADKLASLITDPLITAQEVALQRGLSVLGAAGPKHLVQIELPVLTGASQPGVLDVGQLVQVNASSPWRGRVRSVSVNAKMPKARQTVQIERHLETV